MRRKRIWKAVIVLMLAALTILAFTACGQQEEAASSAGSAESTVAELNPEDMASLMQQVADKEVNLDYAEVVPEKAFANAEVFGIDRAGDTGRAYVYLNEGGYAVVKDKAYMMTAATGVAIVHFTYTADGPALTEVEWSADGTNHDKWIEENIPEEYLQACQDYVPFEDDEATSKLDKELYKQIEAEMGAPVELENLLEINLKKGTYKIVKVIESGDTPDDYTFDTEVVEKGKLSDLAE